MDIFQLRPGLGDGLGSLYSQARHLSDMATDTRAGAPAPHERFVAELSAGLPDHGLDLGFDVHQRRAERCKH